LAKWQLYKPTDLVLQAPAAATTVWIGYRTTPANMPFGTTHFDLNIIDGVCYILHVELVPEHRGRGHGAQLYDLLVAIAREWPCDRVEQTPSGWTTTGETRAKYLERHGWTLRGNIAEKELTNGSGNRTRRIE